MSNQDSFNVLDQYLTEESNTRHTSTKSDWMSKIKNISTFKVCISTTTITSILSCILLFSLCISCIVIYDNVSQTLEDAKGTLVDLNIILPEIHNTMLMLRNLCNTPEFKYYCYPKDVYILK